MRIRYYCHWGKLTGYGRAARDNVAALARIGADLQVVALGGGGSPEERYHHLDELIVGEAPPLGDLEAPPVDVAIYHAPPRTLALVDWPEAPDVRRIAMTTWETSHFPAEFSIPLFNRYEKVIVPSTFCAKIFNAANLVVSVVPHTFDPEFWRPVDPPTDGPTRFYTIGAWGERKNCLGVLRAYLHAFTKNDNVALAMVISNPDFTELRSTLVRSGLPESMWPRLHVPDIGSLSEAQLYDVHASAHCFVSATRGEGWGLGMFEAAIMGRPVVAPRWGGQRDFLPWHVFTVEHSLTPCFGSESDATDAGGMRTARVSIPPGVDCRQLWAEPNIEQLASYMRVVAHQDESGDDFCEDAADRREDLVSRFGYNAVGPALLEAIER